MKSKILGLSLLLLSSFAVADRYGNGGVTVHQDSQGNHMGTSIDTGAGITIHQDSQGNQTGTSIDLWDD